MKYRLDTQHYHQDKLLEPGTEVGDDTDFPWRDAKGHPLPPSLQMTPLDDEAKRLYRDWHESDEPQRDPTHAIPIQGTGDSVRSPPAVRPGVPTNPAARPATNPNPPVGATPPKPAPEVRGAPGATPPTATTSAAGPKVGDNKPAEGPKPGEPDHKPAAHKEP